MSAREPVGPNLRGPCPSCAAPLATDQRYCVECGERIGDPLSLPYGFQPGPSRVALPMRARLLATLALAALGFGLVVGTAMSTVLDDTPEPPPPHVAQVRPPPAPAPAPAETTPPSIPAPELSPIPSFSPYPSDITSGDTGRTKTVKPKPMMLGGVVVQVNTVAGSYSIANGGALLAIHTKKLPQVGMRVRTPVRQLVNGTYAEDGKRKTRGRSAGATFTGTVTFRDDDPGKDFYTVSNTGSSILVRVPPDLNGVATPPEFGAPVAVTVRFDVFTPPAPAGTTTTTTGTTTTTAPVTPPPVSCDDGEAFPATPPIQPTLVLTQTAVTVDPRPATSASLSGIVQAVCPGTGQLVLSADGTRESGRDIVIAVPEAIDLNRIAVGRAVTGTAELALPSSLSLSTIASDQGIKGADSAKQRQG